MNAGPVPDLISIHVIQLKQIFGLLAQFPDITTAQAAYPKIEQLEASVQLKESAVNITEEDVYLTGLILKFYGTEAIFGKIKEALKSGDNATLEVLIRELLIIDPKIINPALLNEAKLICELGRMKVDLQNTFFNILQMHHANGISILRAHYGEAFLERLIEQDQQAMRHLLEKMDKCIGSKRFTLFRNLRENHVDGLNYMEEMLGKDYLAKLKEEEIQLKLIGKIQSTKDQEQDKLFIELRDRHEGGLELLEHECGIEFVQNLTAQSAVMKRQREQLSDDMGFRPGASKATYTDPISMLEAHYGAMNLNTVLAEYQDPVVPAFEELKDEASAPRRGRRNSALPTELSSASFNISNLIVRKKF